MYKDSIFVNNNQAQNNILKRAFSNNYLFNQQKISSLSKNCDSTHSLPMLFKEKTSFTQFIADEKYNLQFFHSFKETRKIINKLKEKKKLIENFHLLSFNMQHYHDSALNNSKIFDDEKTLTSVTHSPNFALNSVSYTTSAKKTKPVANTIAHEASRIVDINKKRRMCYVERHLSYMNDEQTKAALCFILQLNTYFNQKSLSLKKESTKTNKDYIQSEKLDMSSEKIIELDTNSTSTLNFLSKTNLNNIYLAETNDSIDISMQLSDNLNCSSQLIFKKNDHLVTFYNRPIINNIFDKTINNIESNNLSSDEKTDNQQTSVITRNRSEINIYQESLTNYNYNISQSSIDLRNFLSKSTEMKSSLPLHSRCLASFEFANREEHLVEIVELPRSVHRISRMDIYKKIHERLVLKTLIDIDLTGLLQTVLQSFS